jgi:hypothetical protein
VGDVVVASGFIQHDMDASPLFPRHEVPLYGRALFEADTALSFELAEAAQQVLQAAERYLGSDTLVSRLSVRWQKYFLVVGHLLMLFICWLPFKGSLDQTIINWDSTSAVMEVSMGIFYACGVLTALSIALILMHRLWRLFSGQITESELIGVRESEEEPIDVPPPIK